MFGQVIPASEVENPQAIPSEIPEETKGTEGESAEDTNVDEAMASETDGDSSVAPALDQTDMRDKANETGDNGSEKETEESEGMSDEEFDALLKSLEDKGEEIVEIVEDAISDAGVSDKESKAIIDALKKQNESYIKEIASLRLKDAENEIYRPASIKEVVVIQGNYEKAMAGDEEAKGKVIEMISMLHKNLTGKTIAEHSMDKMNKASSDAEKVSGSSAPNDIQMDSEESNIIVI